MIVTDRGAVARYNPAMNIILFGYRGSGKTTVGRKLASQLWKDFVDTDTEVCNQFECDSIAEIWDRHGEAAFRKKEVLVTCQSLARDEQVIALGGGTLMQSAAREAIEHAPDTRRIYLYCELQELDRRICGDQATAAARPDLTPLGGGMEEIKTVLAERDPVYRAVADKVFNVTNLDPDNALRYLIKQCL